MVKMSTNVEKPLIFRSFFLCDGFEDTIGHKKMENSDGHWKIGLGEWGGKNLKNAKT